MSLGDLKIKVKVDSLIKHLSDEIDKSNKRYEKELQNYISYMKKNKSKISDSIRKIADQVDDLDFSQLNSEYRERTMIKIPFIVKSKPSKPDNNYIEKTLRALKISSEKEIILKQEDYNRFF